MWGCFRVPFWGLCDFGVLWGLPLGDLECGGMVVCGVGGGKGGKGGKFNLGLVDWKRARYASGYTIDFRLIR